MTRDSSGCRTPRTALAQARERCRELGHVRLVRARVPGQWPPGWFDLILLSEVVYYLNAADMTRLVARLRDSLRQGGDVVLAHWTGETHYPLTGDQAAEGFVADAEAFLRPVRLTATERYHLDVLTGRGRDADGGKPPVDMQIGASVQTG